MYAFKIHPINGTNQWNVVDCPTKLTPPIHHTPFGRPRKRRRKTVEEVTEAAKKIRRVGKIVTCVQCGKEVLGIYSKYV